MSTPTADQFLMGGGVKSAKFEHINDSITGIIAEQPEVRQQTDLATGELKTWQDGRPMMQLVVTLQTDLRDDGEDDGQRRVYLKSNSLNAVRDAVRKVGAKGLEVGGKLRIVYVGDGPQERRGFNPPKLYLAQYARPAAQEADAFLASGGGAQPQSQQGFTPNGQSTSGFGGGAQPQAEPPF